MLRVLFFGEIVGLPAVRTLKKKISSFAQGKGADFVIANADGASDGYGVMAETAAELLGSGIGALTGGDLIYNKKNIKEFLDNDSRFIRPVNLPYDSPGKGFGIFDTHVAGITGESIKIGIINILGRNNFNKIFPNDPYILSEGAIKSIKKRTPIVIADFHGGTTSEIQSMQWFLSGNVSAVIGTHSRVLTADSRIIDDYTAIITGAGYCGGYYSIGGLDPAIETTKILTGRFSYSKITKEDVIVQGVLIDIDETDGRAINIESFNERI